MDADEELPINELPRGFTPIWIQPPSDATQAEKLERVKSFIGQKTDVMDHGGPRGRLVQRTRLERYRYYVFHRV